MNKYVALLRGVNVGGRVVKMAELKMCFEKIGLKNVATLIQSGNVLFESSESNAELLRSKIEAAVSKAFNYPAKILVYPIKDLQKAVKAYPFPTGNISWQFYVVFMEKGLAKQMAAEVEDLDAKFEAIKLGKDVIYWKIQKGMTLKTAFAKYLNSAKYKNSNTVRNIKTLQKLIS